MKKIKLLVSLGLVLVLILSIVPTYANEKGETEEKSTIEILEENLATEDFSEDEKNVINEMIKAKKETEKQVLESLKVADKEAKEKIKKNKKYLIDEETARKQEALGFLETSASSTITLSLGNPFTFTYAAEGKNGGSKTGVVTTYGSSYDLNKARNLTNSETVGTGNATGWAWTGRRFIISGTGSKTAYFSIEGDYIGYLLSGGRGNVSQLSNEFRLYNATTQSWVSTKNITLDTVTMENESSLVGTFNKSNLITATLQAGHEYVILMQTDAYTYSTLGTSIANIKDSHYSQWKSVKLTY
ncbi:hypothetical protein [Geosporobacter ferrireducens]|uniref:Uncharacterized protein n=1 Tax=Geosporobacter ferrireducens TaxID=1424294 RepID=A0A1D8GKC1_9FIRM|nr:hypothetical protein [Geosporobacter ferrireducens]AOT71353.1 hypothetical protein Gferi_18420 [Geosporobacter ferrireducens]